MKKLFCLIVCFLVWLPCTGFTSQFSGTVMSLGGQVHEVVVLEFDEGTATRLGTSLSDLELKMQTISSLLEPVILGVLAQEISLKTGQDALVIAGAISVDASIVVGETSNLSVVVGYSKRSLWDALQTEILTDATTKTTNTFFTKTTTQTSRLRLSEFQSGTVKVNLFDFIQQFTLSRLNGFYGTSANLNAENYSFSFATTSSRLHSNADEIETNASGVKFHTWNLVSADATMTIWEVRANVVNWYITALGLTAVFGAGLWLVGHFKKPKKEQ